MLFYEQKIRLLGNDLIMVGILFWNTCITNKSKTDTQHISRIEDAIVNIVQETDCDIIVLAEFNSPITGLCNKLSLIGRDFRERKSIAGNARVKILADNRILSEIIRESRYYIIHNFNLTGYHFLLGGVHFPSKLCTEPKDVEVVGSDFICATKESERETKHEKVIMIGDFNTNPFEPIITDFGYLHAIFDSSTVEQARSRELFGIKKQIFYNPMWNLLGDANYPKGSYYSNSGKASKLFWNIFDQVIISADIIKAYKKDSLKILTGVGDKCFVNKNGKPDEILYSDHLPLFFALQEDLL